MKRQAAEWEKIFTSLFSRHRVNIQNVFKKLDKKIRNPT
jgi:hypothetical protein